MEKYCSNNSGDTVQAYQIGSSLHKLPDWIDKAVSERRLFWTPERGYQVSEKAGPYRQVTYGKLKSWIVLYSSGAVAIYTDAMFQENFTKVEEEKVMDKHFRKADKSEVIAWQVGTAIPDWVLAAMARNDIQHINLGLDSFESVSAQGIGFVKARKGNWIIMNPVNNNLSVWSDHWFHTTFEEIPPFSLGEPVAEKLRAWMEKMADSIHIVHGVNVYNAASESANEIERLTKELARSEATLATAEDTLYRIREFRKLVEGL